jgi:hypothetical protein
MYQYIYMHLFQYQRMLSYHKLAHQVSKAYVPWAPYIIVASIWHEHVDGLPLIIYNDLLHLKTGISQTCGLQLNLLTFVLTFVSPPCIGSINVRKMPRGGSSARSPGGPHGLHNAGYLTDDYPMALSPSDRASRNREDPPGYGDRAYGDDSYPLGGPYPVGDYTIPLSANSINPPHYNYK